MNRNESLYFETNSDNNQSQNYWKTMTTETETRHSPDFTIFRKRSTSDSTLETVLSIVKKPATEGHVTESLQERGHSTKQEISNLTLLGNSTRYVQDMSKLDNLTDTQRNLSIEEIHANNYSPIARAGDLGRPVFVSKEEATQARRLFDIHQYNIAVGDKISIYRTLPDKRNARCREKVYELDKLPSVSIIIIFHNEAWSTLMRTVMSILLIDDGSDRKYLLKDLEEAVANCSKVRILRQSKQRGIVSARLFGARVAVADVLLFLDSHCEVTAGWLEPLIARAASGDVYVTPFIDIISPYTFGYIPSKPLSWGAFNWLLHFRWYTPNAEVVKLYQEDPTTPIPTPVMAGGLFAVKKTLFWSLGSYDEGMRSWGSENLELSWRAWMCGARVEIALCSIVGHIFRSTRVDKLSRPMIDANVARTALVWMDKWGDFFFRLHPRAASVRDKQNVADRLKLRDTLKCKSFEWYLTKVWPTHYFPADDRWFGLILSKENRCLGVPVVPGIFNQRGYLADIIPCGKDSYSMPLLVHTAEGMIIGNENLCLEYGNGRALWTTCAEKTRKQIWRKDGRMLKSWNGLCLTAMKSNKSIYEPVTSQWCKGHENQIWRFERIPWHT